MFRSTLAFLFCKLSKEWLFSLWKFAWFQVFFPKMLPDSLVGSLLRNKHTCQSNICLRNRTQASPLPTQGTSHVWPQESGLAARLWLSHIHLPGLLAAWKQLRPGFEPQIFHTRSLNTRFCSAGIYDWHHHMLSSPWIVSAIQTQTSL